MSKAVVETCGSYVQAGEADVVLAAGEKALMMKESKPLKRDILLAMALAQCSLAAQAFDSKDEVSDDKKITCSV